MEKSTLKGSHHSLWVENAATLSTTELKAVDEEIKAASGLHARVEQHRLYEKNWHRLVVMTTSNADIAILAAQMLIINRVLVRLQGTEANPKCRVHILGHEERPPNPNGP